MTRWKRINIFKKSLFLIIGILHISKRKIIEQHFFIFYLFYPCRPKRLHFATKNKLISIFIIIERFFTKTIPGSKKRFFFFIPNGKGKHSIEIKKTVFFPV